MSKDLKSRGELNPSEPHPAAYDAQKYIASLAGQGKLSTYMEAFASCAIEGNRLAEICSETLNRLMNSQPVSDRYILGLAFTLLAGEKAEATRTTSDGE
jgi:hypothetical protein